MYGAMFEGDMTRQIPLASDIISHPDFLCFMIFWYFQIENI